MGLHGVLSAMRRILLDFDTIPPSETERRALYGSAFTDLTGEELEDLVKISAERFEIYKATIFTGEASTLRNHFRLTFGLCSKVWKQCYGQKLHTARLVRQMHTLRPWTTATTDGLARNLVAYLQEDLPELLQQAPEVSETVLLEYTNIGIKRFADPVIGPRQSLTKDDFVSLTVEELLALPCIVVPGVQCLAFTYDVIQAYNFFSLSRGEIPQQVEARSVLGIGARDRDHRAVWVEAGPSLFDLIKNVPRDTQLTVQAFAEACLPDAGATESEEELFTYFMKQLFCCIDAGAVVVLRA